MKFVDTQVVFSEIPDEITLAINISNCPCKCKGCHSAYLAQDIGALLTEEELLSQIAINEGITCVSFMGGDADPSEVLHFARFLRENKPHIKVAWYSGRPQIAQCALLNLHNFDYIKVGPYQEERGPLNNPNTNQKLFKVERIRLSDGNFVCELLDITNRLWK